MPEVSTGIANSVFYRKLGVGPAAVLLHGFPESSTIWKSVWDELSRSFTLIIPDLPGSGNSILNGVSGISDMAVCVKSILDHEAITDAVIVGHSMGGYVAFAFAASYPGSVAGLSLVHSTSRADDEEKVIMRQKSIELILKGGKNAFIGQMVPNLFSNSFNLSSPLIVKKQIEEALKMNGESMVNFYNAMIARKDNTALLDNALFPVQWIAGKEDNVIHYRKILELCHKSDINFVSFYPNCGHMSMVETPGILVEDLNIFINYCFSRSVNAI